MLFPIFWGQAVYPCSLPVVVAQPDERHANRAASVLEWYDSRHRAYVWLIRRSSSLLLQNILDLQEQTEARRESSVHGMYWRNSLDLSYKPERPASLDIHWDHKPQLPLKWHFARLQNIRKLVMSWLNTTIKANCLDLFSNHTHSIQFR